MLRCRTSCAVPAARRAESIFGDQIARSRGRPITSSVVVSLEDRCACLCTRLRFRRRARVSRTLGPASSPEEPTSSRCLPTLRRSRRSFCSSCCSSRRSRGRSFCTRLSIYRRAERQTATFLDVFRKSSKFSEVQAVCPTLQASPLVGIFQSGYAELNAQLRTERPGEREHSAGRGPADGRRRTSNIEEPRRRRPGTAARDDRGAHPAGTSRTVSRNDGEHHSVHRTVRHGVGNHDGHFRRLASRDRRVSNRSVPTLPKR